VASTFGTRAERKDVQNIERTLKLKLSLKETPAGLAREERKEHTSEPRGFKSRPRRFAAAV
jgi:hypothetical protein